MEIANDPDDYFISSTQLESLHGIVHIVGKHLSGDIFTRQLLHPFPTSSFLLVNLQLSVPTDFSFDHL